MKPATPEAAWRRYDEVESRLTGSVSERMLDLAGVRPGMHVLDIATGRGEPALRAARRVGERGSVLCVDHAEGVLRMARERADREGLSNIEFRMANAEALDDVPSRRFDVVTARWPLMYMRAPRSGLASAYRAAKPGGILVLAVW